MTPYLVYVVLGLNPGCAYARQIQPPSTWEVETCATTAWLIPAFYKRFIFIFTDVDMGMCVGYPRRPETLDPLKLKFQAAVTCGHEC